MITKYKVFFDVKDSDGNIMKNDSVIVDTKEEGEKEARAAVDYWNSTLQPREKSREFLSLGKIEEVTEDRWGNPFQLNEDFIERDDIDEVFEDLLLDDDWEDGGFEEDDY